MLSCEPCIKYDLLNTQYVSSPTKGLSHISHYINNKKHWIIGVVLFIIEQPPLQMKDYLYVNMIFYWVLSK